MGAGSTSVPASGVTEGRPPPWGSQRSGVEERPRNGTDLRTASRFLLSHYDLPTAKPLRTFSKTLHSWNVFARYCWTVLWKAGTAGHGPSWPGRAVGHAFASMKALSLEKNLYKFMKQKNSWLFELLLDYKLD